MPTNQKYEIGIIGLSTMGANLARNFADKKIKTICFNRTTERTETFIKTFGGKNLNGEKTLSNFIKKIAVPRKIILMVKSGEAVDELISKITPLLDKNDILIDCGNSHYKDTKRRFEELKKIGINFIGCGVSGGEEGALKGPSIMPGGDKQAYQKIEPYLKKIAAKDFAGKPCVTYVGLSGSGHLVKMIHNGIEYGIMELIAETYDLLRKIYKLSPAQIAKIFQIYNKGKLQSYLFEITGHVLAKKDNLTKSYLIDKILDKSEQKGTGKWTVESALEEGLSIEIIASAVLARIISHQKILRTKLSKLYPPTKTAATVPLNQFTKALEDALYSAIILTYLQGYELIKETAAHGKWTINLPEITRIWQGGCIIRSDILKFLKSAHSLDSKEVQKTLKTTIPNLRKVSVFALINGVPSPSFLNALSYFDGITSEKSPANLIQGLRDYFGAHTYERTDKKGIFHTNWNSHIK
ncbi:MAG: NADP-dependent phosphogluconate dehydrogenase [Candidatus Gracilibacteria bacterium]|jgi:6-phosphogluconate dehydrogenase